MPFISHTPAQDVLPIILVAGLLVANILLLQPTKSLQLLLELKHL